MAATTILVSVANTSVSIFDNPEWRIPKGRSRNAGMRRVDRSLKGLEMGRGEARKISREGQTCVGETSETTRLLAHVS